MTCSTTGHCAGQGRCFRQTKALGHDDEPIVTHDIDIALDQHIFAREILADLFTSRVASGTVVVQLYSPIRHVIVSGPFLFQETTSEPLRFLGPRVRQFPTLMRVKPRLGPTLANPLPGAACSSTFSDHLHFCWLLAFLQPMLLSLDHTDFGHGHATNISIGAILAFISSHGTRTLGPFQSPCPQATPSSTEGNPGQA